MGVKMNAYIKSNFFRQSMLAFTGMPLLIWAMGNLPERSLLKEITFRYDDSGIFPDDRAVFLGTDEQIRC